MSSSVRYQCFPQTEPPPAFVLQVVDVFRNHEAGISTEKLAKGLTSDQVLLRLAPNLASLGFEVEKSKKAADRIHRPVFFGENGEPTLEYQVDGYHIGWRCGLEIEAGRAWMGNAVYRDLIQAMVMVEVDWLVLAVPNAYRYKSDGKPVISADFHNAQRVAAALYAHDRLRMPFKLALIGY